MKRIVWLGLLMSAVLLAALAAAPVSGGADGLDRAKQAQERHTDELLAIPGVVGTAVGHGAAGRAAVLSSPSRLASPEFPARSTGYPW